MNNFKQYFSRLARRLIVCLVSALGMVVAVSVTAQNNPGDRAVIEIVQIEHRDPATIKRALMPLLDSRGSIGQLDDKLVIATTASNLLDLKSLIGTHDVEPKRLIVSVDFLHFPDNGSDNNRYQYSSQALEGEQVSFVAERPEESEAMPPALQNASIVVLAQLRGETAEVDLNVRNLSGFTNQQLQLPLGQWYVLDPVAAESVSDAPADDEPDRADTASAPIAVRVDALP